MADIAFLLLIFFLVTTVIEEDRGVLVRLPEYQEDPPPVITSEVLTILVNSADDLLIEDERAEVADIPELLRDHVLSPKRSPDQAVVSLTHDRSTSYTRYLEVYDALLAGYHRMWDEVSNRRYGRAYAELTDLEKKKVRDEIPMIVSEAEPSDVPPPASSSF